MEKVQKYVNARLMAVQAVYAHEQTGENWDKVIFRFTTGETGGKVLREINNQEEEVVLDKADMGLFKSLTQEAATAQENIENILRSIISEKTDYDRLELVLKCILRVAVAEFYVNQDLPTAIIINEYVDMTRAFFNGSEPSMVNVVLGKFAKTIR